MFFLYLKSVLWCVCVYVCVCVCVPLEVLVYAYLQTFLQLVCLLLVSSAKWKAFINCQSD